MTFKRRLGYPPTLALIKHLATLSNLPKEVSYIGDRGLKAIKNMPLVNRGRLSEWTCHGWKKLILTPIAGVQPVDDAAYNAIVELGTKGGWDSLVGVSGKTSRSRKAKASESSSELVKTEDNETLEEKPPKGERFLPREDGTSGSEQGQRRSKRLKRSLP